MFDVPLLKYSNYKNTHSYHSALEAALYYLKHRLSNIRKISPSEFVLSNDFRGSYAPNVVLPVKKISEYF